MSEHGPSIELLESTHAFPGVYHIKAIGTSDNEFERRVVAAVTAELAAVSDLEYSRRETPGGRHVALTLAVTVQSAAQVRAIYTRLHGLEGITLLL